MKNQPGSKVSSDKTFVITKQTKIKIWREADSNTTVYIA